jgi:hypothetical protein
MGEAGISSFSHYRFACASICNSTYLYESYHSTDVPYSYTFICRQRYTWQHWSINAQKLTKKIYLGIQILPSIPYTYILHVFLKSDGERIYVCMYMHTVRRYFLQSVTFTTILICFYTMSGLLETTVVSGNSKSITLRLQAFLNVI